MSDVLYAPDSYAQDSSLYSYDLKNELMFANNDTAYGMMSNLIVYNMEKIDMMAECLGNFASGLAAAKVNEKYYEYTSDGSFGNKLKKNIGTFFKRNVYLPETEKQKLNVKTTFWASAADVGVQAFIKFGTRAAVHYLNKKDIFEQYLKLYAFLNMFVNEDNTNADIVKNNLYKRVLSSFDLNLKDKIKIAQKVSSLDLSSKETIIDVFSWLNHKDDEFRTSAAFLLYDTAMLKYQDDPNIMRKKLIDYFYELNFGQKYAEELLSEFADSYEKIQRDNHNINNISAKLVNKMAYDFPEINFNEIVQRSAEISKFDPYALRRKNVQEFAKKTAEISFSVLMQKLPVISDVALLNAFSQVALNDDSKNVLYHFSDRLGFDNKQSGRFINNAEKFQNDIKATVMPSIMDFK